MGKGIIILGLAIAAVGVVILLAERLGLHRLPGDIVVRRGGATFFFPVVSCIVVSIILSIVLNLILRNR